ncbi:hypothetical protein [Streptomyces roseolilacinus]|uniref:hypothetical protein n=1 Tax=Streptomyces roseolilacinus TaxID=66904 RepID=UPI0037F885C6
MAVPVSSRGSWSAMMREVGQAGKNRHAHPRPGDRVERLEGFQGGLDGEPSRLAGTGRTAWTMQVAECTTRSWTIRAVIWESALGINGTVGVVAHVQ